MATKKKAPASQSDTPADKPKKPGSKITNDALDKATIYAIVVAATGIKEAINKKKKPELKMPVRALSNVSYDPKKGFFEIGNDKKVRALTVTR